LERTRILLADMPQMLRDIVAGILVPEPDLEVVAETAAVNGLPDAVSRFGADVVIVGRDDPSLATTLMEGAPRIKVLAVTAGGRESWLYELRPQRVSLGEISPQRLVDEIRKRMNEGGGEWWTE
jgi:DNA-binding NarL/FixJ family response regulator